MSLLWLAVWRVFVPAIALMLPSLAGASFYLFWIRRKYSHLPSPPMTNFFLGHLQTILKAKGKDGSGTADQAFIKWASEVGDLYVVHVMWMSVVMVLNKDDVKIVHTVPRHNKPAVSRKVTGSLFGERFLGNGLVVIEDYETWRPRRKLYDPAFNKSYLKGLCPKFNESVDAFLHTLSSHADGVTQVPLKKHISAVTLDIISKVAFASDFNSEWDQMPLVLKYSKPTGVGSLLDHTFVGMQKVIENPLFQYIHPFETRSYRETIRAMRTIGRECIKKRIRAFENKEQLPDDILTHILGVAISDAGADLETLVDDFLTFYVAGQETTANTLSFAVALICEHPEVHDRLVCEVDEVLGGKSSVCAEDLERLQYTEQVIEETLRMYPPLPGTSKQASPEGVVLSGHQIPAGALLATMTAVSCRLPEHFDNPDTFNPSRFDPENTKPSPFVYFPFGTGHRSCIGKHFAMIEAKIILARLFQTFRFVFPPGYKVEVTEKGTRQPKGDIPCILQSRST